MEDKSGRAATKSSSTCQCCCLVTKLMRKLKRRSRTLRGTNASRQSSFQCRYDPLSYSLNFDSTLLDEDYYKFYAFSSRPPNSRKHGFGLRALV
ncbi:hypothetical protein RJT34_03977 [Clitoria ternatea]|uniref:Uncharacterized protein n=1 Tax=Clitoria ternatea TaxID=43366 RepID=A0AAN9KN81_CLITE